MPATVTASPTSTLSLLPPLLLFTGIGDGTGATGGTGGGRSVRWRRKFYTDDASASPCACRHNFLSDIGSAFSSAGRDTDDRRCCLKFGDACLQRRDLARPSGTDLRALTGFTTQCNLRSYKLRCKPALADEKGSSRWRYDGTTALQQHRELYAKQVRGP
jgi:hypothetical protein